MTYRPLTIDLFRALPNLPSVACPARLRRTEFAFFALLGAWACCSLGCTSVALSDPTGWFRRREKPQTPTRLVVVWTDTIMNQPGQRGVRGVGGRLLFYGAGDESPVAVAGKLSVYAYDDTVSSEVDAAPARKFVFEPDQWASHHSLSQMGHSYNVWLPWDEVGGAPRQLTLVARFEPEEGAVVMSDPARQLLPGVGSLQGDSPRVEKSTLETAKFHLEEGEASAKLVNYAELVDEVETSAKRDGLETFTIDLPADVARRWRDQANATVEKPRRRTESAAALAKNDPHQEATIAPPADPRRRIASALAEHQKKIQAAGQEP